MTYSKKEIEEALIVLKNMRENCIANLRINTMTPFQDKKYKALDIVIGCVDFAKIMCFYSGN